MSQKENDDNNKKEDNKGIEKVNVSEGEENNKSKMTAEQQMIENNSRVTMNALNFMSADSNGSAIICLNTKIFPKKVHKYKVVKHYIKGEKLGKGSIATVREFVDPKTLKRIAGKIFKREDLKKDQMVHLEKEFKLVGKLDHINVINVFDKHETHKKIYLFMEYGIAVLDEVLSGAPDQKLPKWQCHRYFTHIIEGLDYLHCKGIIHRDIKPKNLIVDTSDVIKICDFGVSHILDWFAANDQLEGVEGAPGFQPPEAMPDSNIKYYSGTKFDIWSSGVTLYRMICGKLPFKDFEAQFSAKLDIVDEITSDVHLWHLLKGIFKKDFNKRLAIEDIKKHRWFMRHHPPNSKPVSVPIMKFGDIYRSMTVLPRLEYHYYIQSSPEQSPATDELISIEEDNIVSDPMYRISPTIRSSRKLKKVRSPHRRNPARRVLFGFLQ